MIATYNNWWLINDRITNDSVVVLVLVIFEWSGKLRTLGGSQPGPR
jgi:hypothetical protein